MAFKSWLSHLINSNHKLVRSFNFNTSIFHSNFIKICTICLKINVNKRAFQCLVYNVFIFCVLGVNIFCHLIEHFSVTLIYQQFIVSPITFFVLSASSLFGHYNHGYNIMRIFYVLPKFPVTTSETKPDY